MGRIVIPTTFRPAQTFWLSETLFLRVSNFFYVSSDSYLRQTVINTIVCPAEQSWLSETVVLRVFIVFQVSSNGHLLRNIVPSTVRMAQPSWRWKTPLLRVSILFLSGPWRTSIMDYHYNDGLSCLSFLTVRDFPSGVSTYTSLK